MRPLPVNLGKGCRQTLLDGGDPGTGSRDSCIAFVNRRGQRRRFLLDLGKFGRDFRDFFKGLL